MPRGGQGGFIQYGKISIQGAPSEDLDKCEKVLCDVLEKHGYPEHEKDYFPPYDEDDDEETDDGDVSDESEESVKARKKEDKILQNAARGISPKYQKQVLEDVYDDSEEEILDGDDEDDVQDEEVKTPEWMQRAGR